MTDWHPSRDIPRVTRLPIRAQPAAGSRWPWRDYELDDEEVHDGEEEE